jgi:hypothetical protein
MARDGSENRTNQCDRCGDEYESYAVFLQDDFNEIVEYVMNKYDNLCKPCRMAVTDYGAYLTKSEAEEMEPKEVPGSAD